MNKLVVMTASITMMVLFSLHGYENYKYNKREQLNKLSFESDIVLSDDLSPEKTPHGKQFILQHKVTSDTIKKPDFGLIFCDNMFAPTPLEKIHLFITESSYESNTELYLYFSTRRIGNFLTYDMISTDPVVITNHKFDNTQKNIYLDLFCPFILTFISTNVINSVI